MKSPDKQRQSRPNRNPPGTMAQFKRDLPPRRVPGFDYGDSEKSATPPAATRAASSKKPESR